MPFKLKNNLNQSILFCIIIVTMGTVCMPPPGSIVNHDRFETTLTSMKLEDYPAFKVYYGGSMHEIPLKEIKSITIDPSGMMQYNNELYYSANIVMKDGSTIFSTEKDNSNRTMTFISIQNTLIGKRNDELFRINLSNIARLDVRQ